MSASVFAPYRGRPIVVLGAGGFLGSWVARLLSQAGADLHLAARRRPSPDWFSTYELQGQMHTVDLAEPGTARALLERLRPYAVFNLAGYGVDPAEREPALAQRLNTGLVEEIGTALADLCPHATLIHAGSALEYGTASGDLQEDTVATPTTLYGQTKLAGTLALARIAEGSGLRAVTARLFTLYGPGEHPGRLLPSLLRAARDGASLPLTSGLQERDFTYVAEAAEGLLRLGLQASWAAYCVNLATGRLYSIRYFAQTAAEILGIPPDRLQFGALPTRPEEMRHLPVSIGRLRRWIQWAPSLPPPQGIGATAAFLASRMNAL